MSYSPEEVMQYVREEDVKFIRLAFTDIFGKPKNIAIMAEELKRAFAHGIAIDSSAIAGFGGEVRSDLFLHPDPATLAVLPWRPEHGRVVRLLCGIRYPDGRPFESDTRYILMQAIEAAKKKGLSFSFGAEMEFYLMHQDEYGRPTKIPQDQASYMDIAPDDKGENVRREICLTLEQMGIRPESSHHEEGPGQNEIVCRYSKALSAADHASTFRSVVKTIAARNGLYADFSPRPLENAPGSGFHINISAQRNGMDATNGLIPGILKHIREMTVFLNPTEESYLRLGRDKAPKYVTWSTENRSQLIRIPAAQGEFHRLELRSPDSMTNPYLAFALLICACLDGLEQKLPLPPALDKNLYHASAEELSGLETLPESLAEAKKIAAESTFLRSILPSSLIDAYCK